MNNHVPPPDEEVSRRLLGTVSYRDRLSAGRLMPPVGMLREDVRSLKELHLLLTPDARSLPGVNLDALAEWVRRTLGDDDLAHIVKSISNSAESYAEACLALFELVGLRLEQARQVLGHTA